LTADKLLSYLDNLGSRFYYFQKVRKDVIKGSEKGRVSTVAQSHPYEGRSVRIRSREMEKVFVFADDRAIVGFGIVPDPQIAS
jgi:hypothetical protein